MEKLQEVRFDRLAIDIFIGDDHARYVFRGDVDETLEYASVPIVARKEIVFDLGQIQSVNSCGVREWVFLIRAFSKGAHLTFENCVVSLVDQFNIVPQTLGDAEVRSFFAPYYCSSCDEEVTTLLKTKDHWNSLALRQAPIFTHHCGEQLEFDALEDSYFNNIQRFLPQKTVKAS